MLNKQLRMIDGNSKKWYDKHMYRQNISPKTKTLPKQRLRKRKRRKLRSEAVVVLTLSSLLLFLLTAMTLSLLCKDQSSETVAIDEDPIQQNGKVIVIDPGHGGIDDGGTFTYIYEKNLTLKIGLLLGDILEDRGYTVIYTRDKDIALGENEVTDLAARVAVEAEHDADLMISLHLNFADENVNERCYGYEIYANPDDLLSMEVAQYIDKHMLKLNYTMSRGVKDGNIFQIIQLNQRSALLLELGFLDDEADRQFLIRAEGQKQVAMAIADGLDEAFGFK